MVKNFKTDMSLQGPDGKWFAVGFGGLSMSDQPYTIVVDGNGKLEERKIGDHYEGRLLDPSVAIVSTEVIDGRRSVVVTRPFRGSTSDHYTFAPDDSKEESPDIKVISASGTGPDLSYHGPDLRSGEIVVLTSLGAPTCVCRNGWKGNLLN